MHSPLTAAELKEFRTLVTEVSSRPGYSIARVAEELGFADSSPLRKILRDPKRTTSRERLEQLRRMRGQGVGGASGVAAGAATGAGSSATKTGGGTQGASSAAAKGATSRGTTSKGGAQGAAQGRDDDFVTGGKAQEFKSRVQQLRQGGWTLDTLATRIGYHHGRSLTKALAKGQVRRRIYDALMNVPAKPNGAAPQRAQGTGGQSGPRAGGAKGGAAPRPAAKTTPAKKTTATSVGTAGSASGRGRATGLLGGAAAYLEAARRHLELARNEVRRAGSASQLLEPGLRGIMDEIEALGRRLNL